MIHVAICIGSSCHLKGSRDIVERLQELVTKNNLTEQIDLSGTFCMGKCTEGVSVTVDGVLHSLSPQTVDAFFEEHILTAI